MNTKDKLFGKEIRRMSDEKVVELYSNLLQRKPSEEEMGAFHFGFLAGIMINGEKK